jgi:hypothetical protein
MALKDTKMPTADATEAKLRLLHLESVSWSLDIHQVLTTRFHNNKNQSFKGHHFSIHNNVRTFENTITVC